MVPLTCTLLGEIPAEVFSILPSDMFLMILGPRQLCWDILKLDNTVKFYNLLLKCNLLAEGVLHIIIVQQFRMFCLQVMQVRHDDVFEYGDHGRGRGVNRPIGDYLWSCTSEVTLCQIAPAESPIIGRAPIGNLCTIQCTTPIMIAGFLTSHVTTSISAPMLLSGSVCRDKMKWQI